MRKYRTILLTFKSAAFAIGLIATVTNFDLINLAFTIMMGLSIYDEFTLLDVEFDVKAKENQITLEKLRNDAYLQKLENISEKKDEYIQGLKDLNELRKKITDADNKIIDSLKKRIHLLEKRANT